VSHDFVSAAAQDGMMRFIRVYVELFRAVFAAFRAPRVQALLVVCLLIALTEALVFTRVEGWSLLDAFYFSVVSMATVGYGDLAPTTPLGKVSCMVFLVVGIGVFVLTVSSIAQAIMRELSLAERKSNAGTRDTVSSDPRPRP
jgi:voltage-gated potassium channel